MDCTPNPNNAVAGVAEPQTPILHYVPLYVTPLFSTRHPTPPTTSTALYTLTVAPQCLLVVGTRVHLHFLYSTTFVIPDAPSTRPDPMSIPLAIRGWIAGERVRSSQEIEYVVKNEQLNAPIRRAFVRVRIRPGATPLPDLGDLVAHHLSQWPELEERSAEPARTESGTSGPMDASARLSRPPRKRTRVARASEHRGGPDGAHGPGQAVALFPIQGRPDELDPSRAQAAAAAPYRIWEVYVDNATSYATQAETDAIQNYGCPIVIGPRDRHEEPRRHISQGGAGHGRHASEAVRQPWPRDLARGRTELE